MTVRSWQFVLVFLAFAFPSAPALAYAISFTPSDATGSTAAVKQIQTERALPQAFVSDPFVITVVDATQSPAIEGVTEDTTQGSDWVVVVADVANTSTTAADVALSDFTLNLGPASTNQPTQAVAIADVNLRAGPGTDSAILAPVVEGTTVTLLGNAENGFLQVEALGQQGWIFADFLSTGSTGVFAPTSASADVVASQVASEILEVDVTTPQTIAPETSQRIVLAFPVNAGGQEYSLAAGDAALTLTPGQRDTLNPATLPSLTSIPTREAVETVNVSDGRTLEATVNERSTEIRLAGIDAPVNNECFAQESEDGLRNLITTGVWLEPAGDRYLVWTNQGTTSAPMLVNHALVAQGLAAADTQDDGSTFDNWLIDADEQARSADLGLWAECTGVHGTRKPEPTPMPTPTPSAAEVRASYPVLPDVRELAIRPGNLIGDKVAFTGTILSIQVAPAGRGYELGDLDTIFTQAAMQLTVYAPDGTTEVVYLGYDGDTTGMFEGTAVTAYGTVVGTESGTNLLGGEIIQPLVKADIVDFA